MYENSVHLWGDKPLRNPPNHRNKLLLHSKKQQSGGGRGNGNESSIIFSMKMNLKKFSVRENFILEWEIPLITETKTDWVDQKEKIFVSSIASLSSPFLCIYQNASRISSILPIIVMSFMYLAWGFGVALLNTIMYQFICNCVKWTSKSKIPLLAFLSHFPFNIAPWNWLRMRKNLIKVSSINKFYYIITKCNGK